MSCCNKKRAQWAVPASVAAPPQPGPSRPAEATTLRTVNFEYVGDEGISVRGEITRAQYRFQARGVRVAVDHRDAAYLAAMPNLRPAQ